VRAFLFTSKHAAREIQNHANKITQDNSPGDLFGSELLQRHSGPRIPDAADAPLKLRKRLTLAL
jgi:hypothetical protein